MHVKVVTAMLVALVLAFVPVRAQQSGRSLYEQPAPAEPSANTMPRMLTEIGLDQKLGYSLPLDAVFRDEEGRSVRLGDYFGTRPVILTLVYYECPMLCTQVLNGLTAAMRTLQFSVGQEFDVVTVSFDPTETPELAAAKKAAYLERYGRESAAAGWHFLTGDQRYIEALTKAVGFRYAYNESLDEFAHVSAIMVATPDGKLSHYFYGIDYGPRDLRLALIEAGERKVGSPVDQILLYCFHYDPSSGQYSLAVMRLVRTAGFATLVALVGGIAVMRRREHRARAASSHATH
jgi:protein SCO1